MATYPPTGFPFAAGTSNFGPTGQMLYITPKFAPRLLRKFYPLTAFAETTNDDYVGVVSAGASVTIRKRPTINVSKYSTNSTVVVQNDVQADSVTMNIDKSFQYAFPINAVQQKQTDVAGWEGEWEDDAMKNTATAIETDFLSTIYTQAASTNTGVTAGAISSKINLGSAAQPIAADETNLVQLLVRCRTALKENNIHGVKPWIYLPPWATGSALSANLLQAIFTGDDKSPLRKEEQQDMAENTAVGKIGAMTVYESNQIYNSAGVWYCVFGCREAVTFATQIQIAERLKNPNDFGDIQRGLQVYGYQVTIPTGIGVLAIAPGGNLAQV